MVFAHVCMYVCQVGFPPGKEVAVYCAVHLGDIIKSMAAYSEGNLPQAMKDAFMQCDKLLKEDEAIEEMRQYDEDEIPTEE